jgi:AcrR family transcriptional regulator
MNTEKKLTTKERIKQTTITLFNEKDTLSVNTNHIAKAMNISPGNLYYHYKNKEEIIREIYDEMSKTFDSFNSFEAILTSGNPLLALDRMFDRYGEMFWEYRFLMRDASVLMALDPKLKEAFASNQEKRIAQIAGVIKYLISEEIMVNIPKEEIPLRARLYWFVSAYWQIFASTTGEVTRESIREAKEVLFAIHIAPFLSQKGKKLMEEVESWQ